MTNEELAKRRVPMKVRVERFTYKGIVKESRGDYVKDDKVIVAKCEQKTMETMGIGQRAGPEITDDEPASETNDTGEDVSE